MDELKKYLQQNREQMDGDTPSAGLLQRIQKQHSVNKKARLYKMLVRVAAAACIITGVFFGVRLLWGEVKDKVEAEQGTMSSNTQPGEAKKLPVINPIDTPQIIEKAENQVTVSQQKVKEVKQLPVSYRLLNSFELNYNKLVSLQLKNIRSTPVYGEKPDYFDGFKTSMRQIGEDEVAIKRQIKTMGLNDELLEQLINLYQHKIELLKNLQQEISGMNNKIKENQQPADSVRFYYISI